jgi:hypothetical protein
VITTLLFVWLVGVTVLLFLASAVNVPLINEHGSGLFIAMVAWFFAVIAAMVHALAILRRRRVAIQ